MMKIKFQQSVNNFRKRHISKFLCFGEVSCKDNKIYRKIVTFTLCGRLTFQQVINL
jgi:hypothetical protein